MCKKEMTASPGSQPRAQTARSPGATMSKPFANSPRMNVLSHKKTGPSWSLGGRNEMKVGAPGPGPGAYTPYTAGAAKPPSYSMLGRLEDKGSASGPGPGAYSPDGKLRKQIPISLQSRHFPKSPNAGQPGPGAYTPVNPNFVQPAWSMLGRANDKDKQTTPGPLDYRPEKAKNSRASSIFSKIKYKDSTVVSNPGPGAYNETPSSMVRRKAPAYSLQGRTSYAPMSSKTPGPGAYQTPEARTNIAYSLTPRRDLVKSAATPGPGAYSPGDKKGRATGLGVGNRFDDKDANKTNPGPGAYTPSVDFYSTKESPPRYSITARRDGLTTSASNPGPGAYTPNQDTVKVSSPRYSILSRLDGSGKGVSTPGPAHYSPQRPVTAPGISMKSRLDTKPSFVGPGPADYQTQIIDTTIKAMAPKYSIGGRDAFKPSSNQTPGPGQYETAFTF